MSDPVIDPSDLAIYLNDPSIDDGRAEALIADSQTLCETIVNPLPAAASVVVKRVAGRAYLSIMSPRQQQLQAAGGIFVGSSDGAVYLSRTDKADLRRIAGGSSGAFSIGTMPTGSPTIMTVQLVNGPTGGAFKLSFLGSFTTGLAIAADGAGLTSALQAIPQVGPGNLTASGNAGGPWTVAGSGNLSTGPLPMLGVDASGLTGGTNPGVLVTLVQLGVLAPGQGLPDWDATYYASTQFVPGGLL